MMEQKRATKLHEFVAHGSSVNCVSLGRKSGEVLVTGGEDRKVNIWSIHKPQCIMTLQGHTTPVECVRFGQSEEMVVAGSVSGALKVWDLEQAKIMRTLTGHKAAITSLDFHPFGDYTASASLDSNIKLWDIKRKGCIFTYKGHTNGVNCLRFSPDGKWIASAGDDGLIKIWDLNAGKLLTDLKSHTAAVNVVEFHPNDLLLASGSSDKTVKFWDLESFNLVDTSEENATPIRSVGFHPEGHCLYCGSGNQAKVYGWEPSIVYDTIAVGWGEVRDIAFSRNKMIGVSFAHQNVSTFVIDTQKVSPLGSPQQDERFDAVETRQRPPNGVSSPRKSFVMDRPPTQCSKHKNEQPMSESQELPSAPSPDDPDEPTTDIKLPDDYNSVFRTRSKLSYSPPTPPRAINTPTDTAKPTIRGETPDARSTPSRKSTEPTSKPTFKAPVTPSQQKPATPSTPQTKSTFTPSQPKVDPQPTSGATKQRTESTSSTGNQPTKRVSEPRAPSPSLNNRGDFKRPDSAGTRRPDSAGKRQDMKKEVKKTETPKRTPQSPRESHRDANSTTNTPSMQQKPKVVAEDFLPSPQQKRMFREEDVITSLVKGHNAVITVLSGRSRNLQIVRAMWTAGNVKNAIDSAVGMLDQAVMVDVLNMLNDKSNLLTLDICAILMLQLVDLMNSKYEHYVETACTTIKCIIKNLGPVIKANITAVPSIGVDISREERYKKCNSMYTQLQSVRSVIEKKGHISTVLSRDFREIIVLMGTLD